MHVADIIATIAIVPLHLGPAPSQTLSVLRVRRPNLPSAVLRGLRSQTYPMKVLDLAKHGYVAAKVELTSFESKWGACWSMVIMNDEFDRLPSMDSLVR